MAAKDSVKASTLPLADDAFDAAPLAARSSSVPSAEGVAAERPKKTYAELIVDVLQLHVTLGLGCLAAMNSAMIGHK